MRQGYSASTKVTSEETNYMSPPGTHPFTFLIKIFVEVPANAYMYVMAKVIGKCVRDVEKDHVYLHMHREIMMYNSALRSVHSFHSGWTPLDIRYMDLFPHCYGATFSMVNDVADKPDYTATILLRDISHDGYIQIMRPCSFVLAELIIKRLALLHATPIGMSSQMYLRYTDTVESHMRQISYFRDNLDLAGEQARISKLISGHPVLNGYQEVIFHHLDKYATNNHKIRRGFISPWTTICHSCCSIRKIMLRPETETHYPNVKFLGTRYLEIDSCISDLIFFMLTSTSDHVLTSLFDVLLITYFDEFKRAVSFFYVDILAYNYQTFRTEFLTQIECNIGRVLFEVGRLYDGESYNIKMMNLLLFMSGQNWLKNPTNMPETE